MTSNKPIIGYIGMGSMGSLMAQNLLKEGYPVIAYNRSKEKLQDVVNLGAKVTDTPRELAEKADIVMSCLTNEKALDAVMRGENGALAGLHAGQLLIDMSTVSPDASRQLYKDAHAQGALVLDAPVSGSTPQAKDGILMILVGGDQEAYQQAKPIFDVLGRVSYYLGESGSGSIMKIIINTLLGIGMQALSESIVLGEKAGLTREQLLDVLADSTVVSPANKGKLANIRNNTYPTQFALPLQRKDLGLTSQLAKENNVSMPTASTVEQLYVAAMSQGITEDMSAIMRLMQKMAGEE
ncbi:MAG TPA: NAD(P)-dependent oxidoreductase [Dictyobacter sp.]|nr:NAD(P)-dependent oxidoreductase [Dictyobacter sp.]